MTKPSGLGRGLSALIPQGIPQTDSVQLLQLPIGNIVPNRYQPRQFFDEESLIALSESIAALGVLQPILVRRQGPDEYELIAGERRWRAARRAGLDTVPALVQDTDDVSALEQAVVENLHRSDLNPLEEAAAYRQLIDDFGLTHDDLSRRVGRSRTAVTNMLRILQLPSTVQRYVASGDLSAGHARALLGLADRSSQERLAEAVVDRGLSVREVEEMVRIQRDGPLPEAKPSPSERARDKLVKGTVEHRPPGVAELEELLGRYLNTSVHVELGRVSARGEQGGRVIVGFGSLEDLERVFKLMLEAEV